VFDSKCRVLADEVDGKYYFYIPKILVFVFQTNQLGTVTQDFNQATVEAEIRNHSLRLAQAKCYGDYISTNKARHGGSSQLSSKLCRRHR
jgi:hypothetical protein